MSFGSFVTALSGLRAAGTAIDVIGDNLANLNTVGFKGSSLTFQDVVADVTGSGSRLAGAGVASPLILKFFGQGSIQNTQGRLDAAIQGDGFFVVRTALVGSAVAAATDPSTAVYTRAGNFRIDKNGILITATGERVQGWSVNTISGQLNPSDAIGDIIVPVGANRAAKATTAFNLSSNLDASASNGTAFSTPINVYDSLGNGHVISATFTKTDVNIWDASISSTDAAVTGITPAGPGTFKFNPTGGLDDVSGTGYNTATGLIEGDRTHSGQRRTDPAIGKLVALAKHPQRHASRGSGPDQPALPTVRLVLDLSGRSSGGPVDECLHRPGRRRSGAVFQRIAAGSGQVVACIDSQPRHSGVGWQQQFSHRRQFGDTGGRSANTGGRGAIIGQSLEGSNVDIANEFTKLIYQRSYSANARVVTTTDEISQETINIKR